MEGVAAEQGGVGDLVVVDNDFVWVEFGCCVAVAVGREVGAGVAAAVDEGAF